MIDEKEKEAVLLGMKVYGGSFIVQLGNALCYADHINTQKIKDTWSDLWNQYLEIGLDYKKGLESKDFKPRFTTMQDTFR